MVEEVTRMSPKGIDVVVAAAGVLVSQPPSKTVTVNYFGDFGTREGLRPLLALSPRPRAVASCSTAAFLPAAEDVVNLCLEGSEALALRQSELTPETAYIDAKRALPLWFRGTAINPECGGSGILLNGVSLGIVRTDTTNASLDDLEIAERVTRFNPQVVEGYGTPDEIADLNEFLPGFENHFQLGQIIFIDGGADAIFRTTHF